MLVLSRRSNESIKIGDSVVITVLEVRGNKVRIGIDAPKDIHVLRTELRNPRGIETLKTEGGPGG